MEVKVLSLFFDLLSNHFKELTVFILILYITRANSLSFLDKFLFRGRMGWGAKKVVYELKLFSEDNALVYTFGESLVVDDEGMLHTSLEKDIISCQKIGRKLILNFGKTEIVNFEAMSAIRDLVVEAVDRRIVRLEITFPIQFEEEDIEHIASGLFKKAEKSLTVDVHRGYKRRRDDEN